MLLLLSFLLQKLQSQRNPKSFWIYFLHESPVNARPPPADYDGMFNLTMGYRTDADIFVPYNWEWGSWERRGADDPPYRYRNYAEVSWYFDNGEWDLILLMDKSHLCISSQKDFVWKNYHNLFYYTRAKTSWYGEVFLTVDAYVKSTFRSWTIMSTWISTVNAGVWSANEHRKLVHEDLPNARND